MSIKNTVHSPFLISGSFKISNESFWAGSVFIVCFAILFNVVYAPSSWRQFENASQRNFNDSQLALKKLEQTLEQQPVNNALVYSLFEKSLSDPWTQEQASSILKTYVLTDMGLRSRYGKNYHLSDNQFKALLDIYNQKWTDSYNKKLQVLETMEHLSSRYWSFNFCHHLSDYKYILHLQKNQLLQTHYELNHLDAFLSYEDDVAYDFKHQKEVPPPPYYAEIFKP